MTDLDKRNLIQRVWARASCPTIKCNGTLRIAVPLEAPCTPVATGTTPTKEALLAVTFTKYPEQVGPLQRWVIDGQLQGEVVRVFQGPLGALV